MKLKILISVCLLFFSYIIYAQSIDSMYVNVEDVIKDLKAHKDHSKYYSLDIDAILICLEEEIRDIISSIDSKVTRLRLNCVFDDSYQGDIIQLDISEILTPQFGHIDPSGVLTQRTD